MRCEKHFRSCYFPEDTLVSLKHVTGAAAHACDRGYF